MPILQWRNDADGFAFVNSWTFDAAERAALTGLAQPLIPVIVAQVAAVLPFPDPILLSAIAIGANAYISMGPLPDYGMCGGMAYTSIDYWLGGAAIPRGAHGSDQPNRTSITPMTLRNIIWGRLITSLTQGGVLQRTIEWSLLLNQVPSWAGGGAGALLARTKTEWTILKGHIDAGNPWPLGLIYTSRNLWDQHQIMAYGYEDFGNGTGRLLVYDNNSPHQYGNTGHSEVKLDFTGAALVATSPSDSGDKLAGFFCSHYVPSVPAATLAPTFGQFVTWPGDPRTWVLHYGARMPVANPTELAALGGAASGIRISTDTFQPGVVRPRDGAMLREHNAAPVYLYAGGAPFHIPDPTWLNRFGGAGRVRLAPAGSLAAFAGPPDEGTLLREWSDPKVYRIMNGQRCWVTTPAELMKYGSFADVRIVPDGGLAAIPTGPTLPPAKTGECASLKKEQAKLAAQIAQLEQKLSEAPDQRSEARIRASLVVAKANKAKADSRAIALQCP